MMNLYDLPTSEIGNYDVMFDNLLGRCSRVSIITKDKKPLYLFKGTDHGPSCMSIAFIDTLFGRESTTASWNDNTKNLKDKPFTLEWLLEEFKKHRDSAYATIQYKGS